MKIKIATLLVSTLTTSVFALSPTSQEGKTLYFEANCNKCHNLNGKFDPKRQKAKNIKNLTTWVRNCDSNFETGWFPEEQEKVVKYLNEIHYNF